jgi:hypothetical protein
MMIGTGRMTATASDSARGLVGQRQGEMRARQCYGECAGSRICPPVDRTCRAFDRSRLSWAAVFSEPHVLCLGQADLRSVTAAKSGVQSAISISVQLIGTIYVLGLANFKGLLVHKATNMSEDQHPASGQIASSTSSESPSLTIV